MLKRKMLLSYGLVACVTMVFFASPAFSGWKTVTPSGYAGYNFTGIWQYGEDLRYFSAENGYLIQNNGSLAHNNGSTTWSAIKAPTNQDLLTVWGASPFSLFTASATGELLRYDNTSWQLQNNASSLPIHSIHGIAKPEGHPGQVLLAVGNDGVFVNANCWTNAWTKKYSSGASTMQALLVSSTKSAKAGGNSGQVWSGSGAPWQSWTAGSVGSNATIYAIWGPSDADLYAVGSSGGIWHSQNNGSTWTQQSTPTAKTLRAIWGVDASTMYAVGDGGTILRFDGTSWVQEASPTTEDLKGVAGYSADNVTIVGNNGVVLAKTSGAVPLPALTLLLQSN
jgi:hypothetical protein